jgi:hypothetical protein
MHEERGPPEKNVRRAICDVLGIRNGGAAGAEDRAGRAEGAVI